jgi:hypothetical protein
VLTDTAIMTDSKCCGVNEGKTRAGAKARGQVRTQRDDDRGDQFHEALVAHQLRKLGPQVNRYIAQVIRFEIAVVSLVKMDYDRQYLADAQLAAPLPPSVPDGKELVLPLGFKALTEIIDMAEEF